MTTPGAGAIVSPQPRGARPGNVDAEVAHAVRLRVPVKDERVLDGELRAPGEEIEPQDELAQLLAGIVRRAVRALHAQPDPQVVARLERDPFVAPRDQLRRARRVDLAG
ncbi:MAG: hypothetical protein AAF682_05840 [Planctomycetota bacterium]